MTTVGHYDMVEAAQVATDECGRLGDGRDAHYAPPTALAAGFLERGKLSSSQATPRVYR